MADLKVSSPSDMAMRTALISMTIGGVSALLLPGALALVACLLWIHLRRYRHLHAQALAALWQPGSSPRVALARAGTR
jgi:predicted membrane protein